MISAGCSPSPRWGRWGEGVLPSAWYSYRSYRTDPCASARRPRGASPRCTPPTRGALSPPSALRQFLAVDPGTVEHRFVIVQPGIKGLPVLERGDVLVGVELAGLLALGGDEELLDRAAQSLELQVLPGVPNLHVVGDGAGRFDGEQEPHRGVVGPAVERA